MCWHIGEKIVILRRYFDSGEMDDFISKHRIYSPEPVTDQNGVRLQDVTVMPMLGNPFFIRPIPKEQDGEVSVVLKGEWSDIEEFKKRFAKKIN